MTFSARLDLISENWPASMKRELRQYTQRFFHEPDKSKLAEDGTLSQPYWLLMPSWLAKIYNKRSPGTISKNALEEILWAQFCVFLSLRIKDDLYDGQGISSLLFFSADQFLAEAYYVFIRHFRHSHRFWTIFQGCLRESIQAFWEVDTMLRRRRTSLKELRDGHARVCSVFKIGSAAVCHLANHRRDYSLIEAAADQLAIAGEVLDDFQDMEEDLRQDQLNYAARFILGTSIQRRVRQDEAASVIAERLLHSNRIRRLFDELGEHVQEANRIMAPFRLSEKEHYFSEYMLSLEQMEDALGRERVRFLFGVVDRGYFY